MPSLKLVFYWILCILLPLSEASYKCDKPKHYVTLIIITGDEPESISWGFKSMLGQSCGENMGSVVAGHYTNSTKLKITERIHLYLEEDYNFKINFNGNKALKYISMSRGEHMIGKHLFSQSFKGLTHMSNVQMTLSHDFMIPSFSNSDSECNFLNNCRLNRQCVRGKCKKIKKETAEEDRKIKKINTEEDE
mmetsp:Transcript_15434/g.22010  ORF Transcript_15434/g.22010 Transcript_15434/m.22010 type:complete len:192 (-) Transcript_15434:171-746(-)